MATETNIPESVCLKKDEANENAVTSESFDEEKERNEVVGGSKVKEVESSKQVAESVNTPLEVETDKPTQESGGFFKTLLVSMGVIADGTPHDKSVEAQEASKEHEDGAKEEAEQKPEESFKKIEKGDGTDVGISTEIQSQVGKTGPEEEDSQSDTPLIKELCEETGSVEYEKELNHSEIVVINKDEEKEQDVNVLDKAEDDITRTQDGSFEKDLHEKNQDDEDEEHEVVKAKESKEEHTGVIEEEVCEDSGPEKVEFEGGLEISDRSQKETLNKLKDEGDNDGVISSQEAPCVDVKEATTAQHVTTVIDFKEQDLNEKPREFLQEETEEKLLDAPEVSKECEDGAKEEIKLKPEESVEKIEKEKEKETDIDILTQTKSQVEKTEHDEEDTQIDDDQKEKSDKEVCEETGSEKVKYESMAVTNKDQNEDEGKEQKVNVLEKYEDERSAQDASYKKDLQEKNHRNEDGEHEVVIAEESIDKDTEDIISGEKTDQQIPSDVCSSTQTEPNEEETTKEVDEEGIKSDDGQTKKSEDSVLEKTESEEGLKLNASSSIALIETEPMRKDHEKGQSDMDDVIGSENASNKDVKETLIDEQNLIEEAKDKSFVAQKETEQYDDGANDKREQNADEDVNETAHSRSQNEQEEYPEETKPSVETSEEGAIESDSGGKEKPGDPFVKEVCEENDLKKTEYEEERPLSDSSYVKTRDTLDEDNEENKSSDETKENMEQQGLLHAITTDVCSSTQTVILPKTPGSEGNNDDDQTEKPESPLVEVPCEAKSSEMTESEEGVRHSDSLSSREEKVEKELEPKSPEVQGGRDDVTSSLNASSEDIKETKLSQYTEEILIAEGEDKATANKEMSFKQLDEQNVEETIPCPSQIISENPEDEIKKEDEDLSHKNGADTNDNGTKEEKGTLKHEPVEEHGDLENVSKDVTDLNKTIEGPSSSGNEKAEIVSEVEIPELVLKSVDPMLKEEYFASETQSHLNEKKGTAEEEISSDEKKGRTTEIKQETVKEVFEGPSSEKTEFEELFESSDMKINKKEITNNDDDEEKDHGVNMSAKSQEMDIVTSSQNEASEEKEDLQEKSYHNEGDEHMFIKSREVVADEDTEEITSSGERKENSEDAISANVCSPTQTEPSKETIEYEEKNAEEVIEDDDGQAEKPESPLVGVVCDVKSSELTESEGVEHSASLSRTVNENETLIHEKNLEKEHEIRTSEVQGGGDDVTGSQNASSEDVKETTASQHAEEVLIEETTDKSVDAKEGANQFENGDKEKREQKPEESINKSVNSYSVVVHGNIVEDEIDAGNLEAKLDAENQAERTEDVTEMEDESVTTKKMLEHEQLKEQNVEETILCQSKTISENQEDEIKKVYKDLSHESVDTKGKKCTLEHEPVEEHGGVEEVPKEKVADLNETTKVEPQEDVTTSSSLETSTEGPASSEHEKSETFYQVQIPEAVHTSEDPILKEECFISETKLLSDEERGVVKKEILSDEKAEQITEIKHDTREVCEETSSEKIKPFEGDDQEKDHEVNMTAEIQGVGNIKSSQNQVSEEKEDLQEKNFHNEGVEHEFIKSREVVADEDIEEIKSSGETKENSEGAITTNVCKDKEKNAEKAIESDDGQTDKPESPSVEVVCGDDVAGSQNASSENIKETAISQHAEEIRIEEAEDKSIDAKEAADQFDDGEKEKGEQKTEESINKSVISCSGNIDENEVDAGNIEAKAAKLDEENQADRTEDKTEMKDDSDSIKKMSLELGQLNEQSENLEDVIKKEDKDLSYESVGDADDSTTKEEKFSLDHLPVEENDEELKVKVADSNETIELEPQEDITTSSSLETSTEDRLSSEKEKADTVSEVQILDLAHNSEDSMPKEECSISEMETRLDEEKGTAAKEFSTDEKTEHSSEIKQETVKEVCEETSSEKTEFEGLELSDMKINKEEITVKDDDQEKDHEVSLSAESQGKDSITSSQNEVSEEKEDFQEKSYHDEGTEHDFIESRGVDEETTEIKSRVETKENTEDVITTDGCSSTQIEPNKETIEKNGEKATENDEIEMVNRMDNLEKKQEVLGEYEEVGSKSVVAQEASKLHEDEAHYHSEESPVEDVNKTVHFCSQIEQEEEIKPNTETNENKEQQGVMHAATVTAQTESQEEDTKNEEKAIEIDVDQKEKYDNSFGKKACEETDSSNNGSEGEVKLSDNSDMKLNEKANTVSSKDEDQQKETGESTKEVNEVMKTSVETGEITEQHGVTTDVCSPAQKEFKEETTENEEAIENNDNQMNLEDQEKEQELKTRELQGGGVYVIGSQNASHEDTKETVIDQLSTTMVHKDITEEEVDYAEEAREQCENKAKDNIEQQPKESVHKPVNSCLETFGGIVKEEEEEADTGNSKEIESKLEAENQASKTEDISEVSKTEDKITKKNEDDSAKHVDEHITKEEKCIPDEITKQIEISALEHEIVEAQNDKKDEVSNEKLADLNETASVEPQESGSLEASKSIKEKAERENLPIEDLKSVSEVHILGVMPRSEDSKVSAKETYAGEENRAVTKETSSDKVILTEENEQVPLEMEKEKGIKDLKEQTIEEDSYSPKLEDKSTQNQKEMISHSGSTPVGNPEVTEANADALIGQEDLHGKEDFSYVSKVIEDRVDQEPKEERISSVGDVAMVESNVDLSSIESAAYPSDSEKLTVQALESDGVQIRQVVADSEDLKVKEEYTDEKDEEKEDERAIKTNEISSPPDNENKVKILDVKSNVACSETEPPNLYTKEPTSELITEENQKEQKKDSPLELDARKTLGAAATVTEEHKHVTDDLLGQTSETQPEMQKYEPTKGKLEVAENLIGERDLALTEDQKVDKEEIDERGMKTDEEDEEEDDDEKTGSYSDAPVMVEASKDMEVKAHKKSHNILSGVGSKVKHSIAKVKKVITGKSSPPKSPSKEKN